MNFIPGGVEDIISGYTEDIEWFDRFERQLNRLNDDVSMYTYRPFRSLTLRSVLNVYFNDPNRIYRYLIQWVENKLGRLDSSTRFGQYFHRKAMFILEVLEEQFEEDFFDREDYE